MVQIWKWTNLDDLGSSYGEQSSVLILSAYPTRSSDFITPLHHLTAQSLVLILSACPHTKPWFYHTPASPYDSSEVSSWGSSLHSAFWAGRPWLLISQLAQKHRRDLGCFGGPWCDLETFLSSFIPLTVQASQFSVAHQLAQEPRREISDALRGSWC